MRFILALLVLALASPALAQSADIALVWRGGLANARELYTHAQMAPVLDYLGRATAKVHCVADKDSDPTIVGFQTEDEIIEAVSGNEDEFVKEMVDFGTGYSEISRDDHRLFVDAFRNGQIPGLSDR